MDNKSKHTVTMKIRSFAALTLIPLSLWSCSLTPVDKGLKNAPKLPANPPWLAKITQPVEEKEVQSALFPDGFLDNYIPARKKTIKIPPQKISSQYDIRKISDVTPQQLDKIFKGKMAGKGAATIKIAKKHGVDPLFISGLACHESNFGQSKYSYAANNVTGQLYLDKKSRKWLPIQFKSVEDCLERTCQRMRDYYIKEGRVTISGVQKKYCPIISNKKSKDFNDPRSVNVFWTGKVAEHMKKIQSI